MTEKQLRFFLLILGLIFLVIFSLTPFIWMLVISFTGSSDFLIADTFKLTFQNYFNVLTEDSLHFLDYLKNSMFVSMVTAFFVTIITCFSGYAVSRLKFPGRIIIPLAVLAMSMFPQISIVGFLYNMFSNVGFLNSYIALILPYIAWTIPIALWINMSYFSQIPNELDKAALIDGASQIKIIFKIIVPLALPGVFSSYLLIFIACFNEFLFAIMLTIDYHAQTLPVGIALFEGIHGEVPWGNLMASSAIASVPLVIITLLFQRYIVRGLTGGAVKG